MRRTLADKKITEETLLKSALKLFIQEGYSNVSVERIAKESNLTRGAFYWHFSSKEDILLRILVMNQEAILESNKSLFELEYDHEWHFVRKLLHARIHNFYGKKEFRDYVELTWFKLEHQFSGESISRKVSINDYFIENLAGVIENGQKNGTIKSAYPPSQLAVNAAVLLNGIYRMYFVSSYLKNVNDALAMADSYCDNLKNEKDTK